MMIRRSDRVKRRFCYTVLIGTLCAAAVSGAKIPVPLFLLSGQSNMSGMQCPVSGLTGSQKDTVKNVKIYQDAEGTTKRKWLTLGPGFGYDNTTFGPELFFGKILADSLPDKKIAFVKVARAGTYLGKATEWLPPSSNNGTGGTFYTAMMGSIDDALAKFNTAFDTTIYSPRWAGFVWLQGEFDAMDATLSNNYEKNLTNLISDIRAKAKVDSLPVILPMIDVQSMWTNNAKIRAADIACKQKLKNVDTLDTKGFATNGIHYQPQGQIKIGTISAQRWLAMNFTKDWWTTPVLQPNVNAAHAPRYASTAAHPTALFDLRGRSIGTASSAHANSVRGVFITRTGGAASGICRPVVNFSR